MDGSLNNPSAQQLQNGGQQLQQQQQQTQAGSSASGPQVRSRITVVCAECKRLKLKCDRKVPCGSCQKRDTVPRCIYSPAAAEKVDLHSLNNRVTALESHMSQFGQPGSRQAFHHHGGGSGFLPNDRALIAVGNSGSSLTIPLEDVTAIWLEHLDLNKDLLPSSINHSSNHPLTSSSASYSTPSQIKLEPTPVTLPSGNNMTNVQETPTPLLTPPTHIYYPSTSSESPSVTPDLVALLPSSSTRRRKLWNAVEDILMMNPCFNLRHFRERSEGIFRWAVEAEATSEGRKSASAGGPASKADFAKSIFFGDPVGSSSAKKSSMIQPTVSFFAAVAGALALGAQANKDQCGNEEDGMMVDGFTSPIGRPQSCRSPSVSTSGFNHTSRRPKISGPKTSHPATLFALSKQALDIFEETNPPDIDYLIALILRVLYMLHDGKPVVDNRLYPLVGKMTNVARMMGLGMDPDEFPGKYSLFEAETRRRIWWDVFCYDLYVSDSMGHPPSILDNSFTTKMPADVDDGAFSPSTTSIPAPTPEDYSAKYFGLKIRLAQLVKSVKKRTFRDPLMDASSESTTIDEAAAFEGEVKQFLSDLPSAFKFDVESDLSTISASSSSSDSGRPSSQTCLIAQQCELAITGQRLVLKLYLPFLRSNNSHGGTSHKQAYYGSIDASHVIVHASRVLHALYKQPPGITSKRPGPAIFDYYSFGQALFDAAVVCSHAVIQEPTAMWARQAMDDLLGALEVMKDPMVATGRGPLKGGVDGSVSEPVKVIEMLKKKADDARSGNISNSGSKRKHGEVEGENDHLSPGFQLPYVGAAVASAGSTHDTGASNGSASASPAFRDDTPASASRLRLDTPESGTPRGIVSEVGPTRTSDSEKGKGKEKNKKLPYPNVGVRVRPNREAPPMMRSRDRAPSSVSSPSSDGRMLPPLTTSQPPSLAPTPVSAIQYQYPVSATQESPTVYLPPSTEQVLHTLQPEQMPTSQPEYSSFDNGASGDYANPPRRKYSVHEVVEPQYSTSTPPHLAFDQGQGIPYSHPQSPASFGPASNGQSSNGSSPFGGVVGGSASLPSPHYSHGLPSHNDSPQSYRPSLPNGSYYPEPYPPTNFDNGSQGVMAGLGMNQNPMSIDTSNGMGGPPSGDMWDVKPLSTNEPIQQPFGAVQGQNWQPGHTGNHSNNGYWQTDFRPYSAS